MVEKEILNILVGIAGILILIILRLMRMSTYLHIADFVAIVIFILILHRYYLARKNIQNGTNIENKE